MCLHLRLQLYFLSCHEIQLNADFWWPYFRKYRGLISESYSVSRQISAKGEWGSENKEPPQISDVENVLTVLRAMLWKSILHFCWGLISYRLLPLWHSVAGRVKQSCSWDMPDLLTVHWLKDYLLALLKLPLEVQRNKSSIHPMLLPSLSPSFSVRSSCLTALPAILGSLSTFSERQPPNKCIVYLITLWHVPLRGLGTKKCQTKIVGHCFREVWS